jgi:peptidase T
MDLNKYETLKDRFLRYVKFETRSDEKSETIPSTPTQLEFAKILAKELEEIGMENVYVNDACFVNATLPGNVDKDVPVIGFIAHMDTADFNATNVNPKIVENYDGKDIVLNDAKDIVLSVEEFPNLKNYVGKTVITTDGTTLLGADDKAGIVEIVEAMKYLIEHPEIKHGTVKVAFGPDEEIGRGADNFNVEEFGADFAYTMDGGPVGELEYESFNAAGAVFKIKGKSVHPGTAKGKLINASLIAAEIVNSFPADEVPEKTEGYEGFYFLDKINSNCEEAELSYILRDHDREKFEAKKKFAANVAKKINEKYGKELVSVEIKDQYYNMGEIIKDHMNVVEIAKKAMENLGIKPVIEPIRGGTDGSKISFMGLPTPNIFAGGENFHGKYEFVALESMILATDVIVEIVKLNGEGE